MCAINKNEKKEEKKTSKEEISTEVFFLFGYLFRGCESFRVCVYLCVGFSFHSSVIALFFPRKEIKYGRFI